jgi:hypothetical protein
VDGGAIVAEPQRLGVLARLESGEQLLHGGAELGGVEQAGGGRVGKMVNRQQAVILHQVQPVPSAAGIVGLADGHTGCHQLRPAHDPGQFLRRAAVGIGQIDQEHRGVGDGAGRAGFPGRLANLGIGESPFLG